MADKTLRFYTDGQLGPKRKLTPEGFLVCMDVAIARIGNLLYAPGEVPIEAGRNGVITIERLPEDVFDPKAMQSFEGKPVTNDHPPLGIKVTPDNWRRLAIGDVHNVRRGDGAILDDAFVYADLMIKDRLAIQDILDGKREVSAGYDADYQQINPGYGRQHNILGNHVALVDQGRCGTRCSIGDAKPMAKRGTVFDRIMKAYYARDEAAVVEELEKVKDMFGNIVSDEMTIPPENGGGQPTHHFTLNLSGVGAPKGTESVAQDEGAVVKPPVPGAAPAAPAGAAAPAATPGVAGAVPGAAATPDPAAGMQQIMARLQNVEQAIMLLAQEDDGGEEGAEEGNVPDNTDQGGEGEPGKVNEEKPDDDAPGKVSQDDAAEIGGEQKTWAEGGSEGKDDTTPMTSDRRRATVGDSTSLAGPFQDMLARAAILAPSVRLPTFDAKVGARLTVDTMCNFRRTVLAKAWGTADGRDALKRLHTGKADFSRDAMSCDNATVLFNAASELKRASNTNDAAAGVRAAVMDHGREMSRPGAGKPLTIADINAKAREKYHIT